MYSYKYGSKQGESITNILQWEEEFKKHDSKGDIHWRIGRSAQCLAKDFMEGNGEVMLSQMVEQFLPSTRINNNNNITVYIEHGSTFDNFKRPRMQDLGIFGTLLDGRTFFIGVEAKVDESFSNKTIKTQQAYVDKQKSLGKSTMAGERLTKLIQDFLWDSSNFDNLRYQLLYYLAGSFREDADIIFMPVVVYKTELYNERKAALNKKAYVSFMQTLNFNQHNITINDQKVIAYQKEVEDKSTGKKKCVYSCYIVKEI